MTLEPAAAGESEILAAALHAHLSKTRFVFTGLTGTEATLSITHAVVQWRRHQAGEADGRHRCVTSTRLAG
ncbi:hypothetical protein [Streptomyces sp. NPDC101234]|uniref:hypothetical protein n=1 Tax=Streptomyces sp. NPDC101234 TaxID=3366138 RepID=UPI0037F1DF38